jgi:hypothetical protein
MINWNRQGHTGFDIKYPTSEDDNCHQSYDWIFDGQILTQMSSMAIDGFEP